MFRIGEFSKLAKTTVKTLRYYDKVGLLKPAFVDSETSYRYYSEAQLEIMREILAYKAVGIQNSDISDILKNGNADAILSAKREQLEALMKSISGQLNEIDKMLCQASKQKYSAETYRPLRYTAVGDIYSRFQIYVPLLTPATKNCT